jgi:hypothetical protein
LFIKFTNIITREMPNRFILKALSGRQTKNVIFSVPISDFGKAGRVRLTGSQWDTNLAEESLIS